MTTNGRIPDSELSTVAHGVQLLRPVANAFRALVLAGVHEHVSIKAVDSIGAGYRSLQVQQEFYDAAHGKNVPGLHLNTSSRVNVAWPGYSSHGWGNRIDLLFDGSQDPTTADLNLAKRFGFTREFGSADSNHFEHDMRTAIQGVQAAPASHPVQEFYTVVPNDNLTVIAQRHGLTLAQIEHLNPQIENYNLIHPGDKIRIR